ncbi:MAG: DUF11 domain-containing protein [Thermoplasmatales archaeon]|nr:MAG: DUF11 domain-containing protein [Thermoplasmatales archaeon]
MKNNIIIIIAVMILSLPLIILSGTVEGGSYDGLDLANAILVNQSTLINSQYTDSDDLGYRQSIVLSSRGTMLPTEGSSFILLSTGIAGFNPATTDGLNPGDERGNWFLAGKYGTPRDQATLTLTLQVPQYQHYIYYDMQFYTIEYPDYIGSTYNDRLTITVDSPSQGISEYIVDVNGGDFVLNSHDIEGSGYDVFATSGNPADVDWLTTTPNPTGADAGATALVGREHPVSPNEQISVTFNIEDIGDNQFDSAVFIDNLRFSGYAKTEIIARKTVKDINGGLPEPTDILEYTITISNIGKANQSNNPGDEFEDILPDNVGYIPGSAQASSGTIAYNSEANKITWDGSISAESSVALNFQVTINSSLANGTEISNQGVVCWDSNEDGTNDATELTDDPAVDDGIDLDGDGETDDDDPTVIIVSSYEAPTILIEDFSDDSAGEKATQSYGGQIWFETSEQSVKSNFEVASSYHYSTLGSFKTKLRAFCSPQYWNYSVSQFNSDIVWWEVWFACGNTSEESDLFLDFKNTNGNDIAKVKFEYVQAGSDHPSDYIVKLSFKSSSEWIQLKSDFLGGYLYNGWYKMRIEKYGDDYINYSLYQVGKGLVDTQTGSILGPLFSNLARIEWSSTKSPVVCPILFWDEHRIGLSLIT